jgi:hypothetical protein
VTMIERTKPLLAAIDRHAHVSFHSPLTQFLVRTLETADGINELLALFDGPEENVARPTCELHCQWSLRGIKLKTG